MGMFIELCAEDGFLSRVYLVRPPAGRGPGIVLLQEIFGLNGQIRGICDLLAEEGYVVLAPDLFARLERDVDLGYIPPEFEKALALCARFDDELGLADVDAAIAALRAMSEVAGGIGAIGFGLGGRMAVKTAAHHEVAFAVSYYGVGIENCLDLVDDVRCPMVLHFAELDSLNPPANVERIRWTSSFEPVKIGPQRSQA